MDYSHHFNALRDYLKPRYSDKPIDSFIQVIMIVLWAVGITVIISKLFDINQKNFDDSGSSFGSYYLDFLEIPFWDLCRVQVSINDMVRMGIGLRWINLVPMEMLSKST
jgi:miniconductance mechanosensitive channel